MRLAIPVSASFIALCASMGLIGFASSAIAAPGGGPPEVDHSVEHGDFQGTDVEFLPCAEAEYELTITTRVEVDHGVTFEEELGRGNFMEVGTIVAEPLDESLPSFSGHFFLGGNGLDNIHNEPGTFDGGFVITLILEGSDGSRLRFHEVRHGVFMSEETGGEDFPELIEGFVKSFCK